MRDNPQVNRTLAIVMRGERRRRWRNRAEWAAMILAAGLVLLLIWWLWPFGPWPFTITRFIEGGIEG